MEYKQELKENLDNTNISKNMLHI